MNILTKTKKMGRKNKRGETKTFQISWDILYSKDVPLEVEAKVDNGVST